MLIGENAFGIKTGTQIVCKRNKTGVYVSKGGLFEKHYLADISNAAMVSNSAYDEVTLPGNKTEMGGKIGWVLGPIGVGIGAAIGGMLDEKDKKSGAMTPTAIQLTYDGRRKLDLLCTSKELAYINDKVLSLFGVTINIDSDKLAQDDSSFRPQAEAATEIETNDGEQHINEPGEQKDLHSELIKLDDLRTKGLISDQEFTALKGRLLDSYGN